MPKIKHFFIHDIAKDLQVKLQKASKKHRSVCAFAIFIEGDEYHAVVPEFDNEKEKKRDICMLIRVLGHNKDLCHEFSQFVVPPARFHKREEKKARKAQHVILS